MKSNEQQPTAYQITHGQLIIPRAFYIANVDAFGDGFTVIAFGREINSRRLDQSYRVRIPFMKEHVTAGDIVAVRLEGKVLFIDRVSA